MKYLITGLTAFVVSSSIAQPITTKQLDASAECVAASYVIAGSLKSSGKQKEEQMYSSLSRKLMDKFYQELGIYANGDIPTSKQLGTLPNEKLNLYQKLNRGGEVEQMKYAQSIMEKNNCLDVLRAR